MFVSGAPLKRVAAALLLQRGACMMAGRYFSCLLARALYPAAFCPVPSSDGRTLNAPIHPILPAQRATHHAHHTKFNATMDCFAHQTVLCNGQKRVRIMCDHYQRANGMLG